MPARTRSRLAAAVLVAALTASACGAAEDAVDQAQDDLDRTATSIRDQATDGAVEAAVRTAAAALGAQAFRANGHPIDGDLTCEADASGEGGAVDVSCTGTTTAGGEADLTGTTADDTGTDLAEIRGDFRGSVDGTEVFRTDRLGG